MPIDGGPPRPFTIGGLRPDGVVVSPDGKRMLVSGYGPSGYALYAVNSDGSGLRWLSADVGRYGEPSWSPDGRLVAFHQVGTGTTTPQSIWVMAADGTQERKIFDFPLGDGAPWAPAWSPDSTRLAVMGSKPDPGAWVIDVASDTNRRVLSDQLFALAWSPDSERLVADPWGPVTNYPDGTSSISSSVVVINADGSGRRDIHTGVVGTWSPSGDIVLSSRLVLSDTGEERPSTFKGIARTFGPDGQHLITEDGDTVFVYDRHWCGRPLVDVDGPYAHWFAWAGPSQVLVRVHNH